MSTPIRDAILAYTPRLLPVELPGLGTVHVRELPIGPVLDLVDRPRAEQGPLIFLHSACDEHGTPLFTEGDLPAISNLPSGVINAVVEAFNAHNKLGDEGKAELGNA